MEFFFVVLAVVIGLATLGVFAVSALAAFFVMTGPPDAYDVDIQGTIKKDE